MFSLNEISVPNIVKVWCCSIGNLYVSLPVEAVELLDHRFSKMYINDELAHCWMKVALKPEPFAIKFTFAHIINFEISEGIDMRWECEPAIIKLWII